MAFRLIFAALLEANRPYSLVDKYFFAPVYAHVAIRKGAVSNFDSGNLVPNYN